MFELRARCAVLHSSMPIGHRFVKYISLEPIYPPPPVFGIKSILQLAVLHLLPLFSGQKCCRYGLESLFNQLLPTLQCSCFYFPLSIPQNSGQPVRSPP